LHFHYLAFKATDLVFVGNLQLIESTMTQNISEPIIIFIISQLKYPWQLFHPYRIIKKEIFFQIE